MLLVIAKTAVTKAYAFTTGILTGKIKLATIAQRSLEYCSKGKSNWIGCRTCCRRIGLAGCIYKKNKFTYRQPKKHLTMLKLLQSKILLSRKRR